MTRVRRVVTEEREDAEAPFTELAQEENTRTAAKVADALAGLEEFTDGDYSVKVFKLPGYGYCKEIDPRDDTTEILETIRDEFGPGNYAVRVYAKGRRGQITEKSFSVAGPRKSEAKKEDAFMERMLLTLLAKDNRNDMQPILAMMQAQAQLAQQSADRQMNAMTAMMGAIVPALASRGESTSQLVAAIAPLMQREPSPGFGEAIETLIKARELFGGGGGGGDDESVVGVAVKALAPSIPDFAKGFADLAARGRQEAAAGSGQPYLAGPGQGHLAPPSGQHMPVLPNSSAHAGAPPSGIMAQFPLLAVIAPDVLFYFSRGLPPELAADGVYEVLSKANVTEADLAPIIAALSTSGDWLSDLAAAGLDLRSNPQWVGDFLANLLAIYRGEDDDSTRGEGSGADAGGNGEAGAVGVASNTDP